MLSRKSYLLCLFAVLLCCNSCTRFFLGTYGIKSIKPLSNEKIIRTAYKYGIAKETIYTLDSNGYDRFLHELKSHKNESAFSISFVAGGMHWGNQTVHDLSQPIQYLLFDRNGKLISWHINCEAGGWPNLKWNGRGDFNQFPPATGTVIDSNITLKMLAPFWTLMQQASTHVVAADYTCVVYWSRFMGRQSRRLVHRVLDNCEKAAPGTKISFLFVNDDNYFYRAFSE